MMRRRMTALLMVVGFWLAMAAAPTFGSESLKVQVCHNGHNIAVHGNAVSAHLAHGDTLGPCES